MNEQSREGLDAYYAQAASWNQDRLDALRIAQRRAWWVAGAAVAVAVLEAVALILLTPLKTVEPYTLLVDRTTGFVQPLKPLDPAKLAPDAALTQSFLVQYVIAREGFDLATIRANYRKVALLSAGAARRSYLAGIQVSNSSSPLASYPPGTTIDVRVKSVSPIGQGVSLVRFDTLRADPNGQPRALQPWVAIVRYRYSGKPMSLDDRFINPLGFEVVSYRRDAESLPSVEAAQPGDSLASERRGGATPVDPLHTPQSLGRRGGGS